MPPCRHTPWLQQGQQLVPTVQPAERRVPRCQGLGHSHTDLYTAAKMSGAAWWHDNTGTVVGANGVLPW